MALDHGPWVCICPQGNLYHEDLPDEGYCIRCGGVVEDHDSVKRKLRELMGKAETKNNTEHSLIDEAVKKLREMERLPQRDDDVFNLIDLTRALLNHLKESSETLPRLVKKELNNFAA